MPAETHQHRDPPDAAELLKFIWLVAGPDLPSAADPDLPVEAAELDDEFALFGLWAVVAEEFAERTLGEPNLTELSAASTFGALAEALMESLTR